MTSKPTNNKPAPADLVTAAAVSGLVRRGGGEVLVVVPWAYPAPEDGRLTPNPTRDVDWEVTYQPEPAGPLLPFAASNPRSVTARHRPKWFPWVSVGLYALGQLILGAAIAAGHITPLLGLLVCTLWLVCGLLLVAAQVLAERPPGGGVS
ncbi:MAG: hypothetical protein AAF547_06635 [Actinomycetota bacterium]